VIEKEVPRNTFIKWIGIGLLLRFIFMPISAAPDLLWFYWRAHLIVYHHEFSLGASQLLLHYIHAFFLWIFTPLMPYYETIWTHPWTPTHPNTPAEIERMFSTFFTFVSRPHIFRTLFLLKFPFLLFDFGCLFFLNRLATDSRKRLFLFKFWMINPVSIFVVYIYGRFEVIPIFFILGSLYYVKSKRFYLALLMLGISAALRLYPLILFIPAIIILGKNTRERLRLIFWGLLPLGIMAVFAALLGQQSEVGQLMGNPLVDYFLSMNFNLGLRDNVYIFIVGYTFLIFHAYYHRGEFKPFEGILKYSLSIFLLFFATSFFHRQFFMWTIPFLGLYILEDKRFLGLFIIQVFTYFIYTLYGGRLTAGYLFTPLNLEYFINLPSPVEVMRRFFEPYKVIAIFRSVFSAVNLYMIYLIFKQESRKLTTEGPERVCGKVFKKGT